MKIQLKEHNFPGKLIVLCGVDGSGKTTMLNMIKNYLEQKGITNYVITKQPRDTVRNMDIFKKMMYTKNPNIDYRAVLLLTLSERIQHCHEEIIPALKEGKIVISDRYIFTTIANMFARGYLDEKWFFDVIKHIIKPDIAFLADAEPELAIKRILSREYEKNRYLDQKLLINVSNQYRKLIPSADFKVINTNNEPHLAFEEVIKQLRKIDL